MKKFTTLLTMAFIALMSISFTSCDDDDSGMMIIIGMMTIIMVAGDGTRTTGIMVLTALRTITCCLRLRPLLATGEALCCSLSLQRMGSHVTITVSMPR